MIQKTFRTNSLLPEMSINGAFRFPPAKECSRIRKVVASGCLGENASFEALPGTGEECDQIYCATAG